MSSSFSKSSKWSVSWFPYRTVLLRQWSQWDCLLVRVTQWLLHCMPPYHRPGSCYILANSLNYIILIMIIALNGFTLFQVRKPLLLDHIKMTRFAWLMQTTWNIFAIIVLLPLPPLLVAKVLVKHLHCILFHQIQLRAGSAE